MEQLTFDPQQAEYRHAVSYRLLSGHSFDGRTFEDRELRRWEFERIETDDFPTAFTDLHKVFQWHVVDWTSRRYGPAKFPAKKVSIGGCISNPILIPFYRKIQQAREKGGEEMARSISVNEILRQAEAAQAAYEEAVEQRKNVKKVATTLAAAGLLDDEDVAKIEDIFPKRKPRGESDEGEE